MADYKHILTFTLYNELFGIDVQVVRRIIWLPELTPIEEVPLYIIGVFNLHGRIVPVIDLDIHFAHPRERYLLTDNVIILEVKGLSMGIIVDAVLDVRSVPASEIVPTFSKARPHIPSFVAGEAKIGEDIIMLVDHEVIAEYGMGDVELGLETAPQSIDSAIRLPPSAFEGVSSEERAVFHERAKALLQAPEDLVLEGLMPVAVVGLGGEYYGLGLDAIREFSDIRSVTPVPCSPPHIVGNMNLRGDILTLVDIRSLLNIPIMSRSTRGKIIVAQINDIFVGVMVDDIFDIVHMSLSQIKPVPSTVKAVTNDFISGEIPYRGKIISILDLKKILTTEELVVNEE